MKKIITIVSAMLILTGLKAQKANVQKETVKPKADSAIKSTAGKQLPKSAGLQKEAKLAPALKYAPAQKETPVIKKAG